MATHSQYLLAFIGAGNIVKAILHGLITQKAIAPENIWCTAGPGTSGAKLSKHYGIHYAPTVMDLPAAEVFLLACKPQHLATLSEAYQELTRDRLVISVLASTSLAKLKAKCPYARNIIRAMPNTSSQVGAGVTGYTPLKPLSKPDQARMATILGAISQMIAVEEESLHAITAISGSGPAYVFEFTAALREAGIKLGLPMAVAQQVALDTVYGAARLMAESPHSPEALQEQVTSPGGITATALKKLAAADFRNIIGQATQHAHDHSQKLARKL